VQETPQVVGYWDIVDAPSPDDNSITIRLGVRKTVFDRAKKYKLSTSIAQYYAIVHDGLIVAEHAFQGIKRPLLLGTDMQADRDVIVYAWRPTYDCEWQGYAIDGTIAILSPPPDRVFVVLVRKRNSQEAATDGVFGTIERWNWVREDLEVRHAPIDCRIRYEKHLWSRNL
jgi:hypothetical protein